MRNKRGFTLIELIITVGIIAILSSIAGSMYSGFQERTRVSVMISHLSDAYGVENSFFALYNVYAKDLIRSGLRFSGLMDYDIFPVGTVDPALPYSSYGYNGPSCDNVARTNCRGMVRICIDKPQYPTANCRVTAEAYCARNTNNFSLPMENAATGFYYGSARCTDVGGGVYRLENWYIDSKKNIVKDPASSGMVIEVVPPH